MRLEDLQPRCTVRGLHPDGPVEVVNLRWHGSEAVELTYKKLDGVVAAELLYREDEPRLELVEQGRAWSFDGDGALFRLVSEAQRIRLAHLFDPVLAVHTSVVEPLPHQITAVYEAMLPRQPLRFLRAELPRALRLPQTGNVAPVDLAQAATGPGMAGYARYALSRSAGASGRLSRAESRLRSGASCMRPSAGRARCNGREYRAASRAASRSSACGLRFLASQPLPESASSVAEEGPKERDSSMFLRLWRNSGRPNATRPYVV